MSFGKINTINGMRSTKLKVFALLLFASTGYWLGRYSCNYSPMSGSPSAHEHHGQSDPNQLLKAKTAKFNRKARLDSLRQCCRHAPRLSDKAIENVLKHLIVDRKNKILYCYIPKVASSNMKRLMLTLQNKTDDSNAIREFDQRGFEFLSDFSSQDRAQILKTFFKFIFVRNPFTRIVSAYRNKLYNANARFQIAYGRDIVRRYRKSNVAGESIKGDDVTFQEFVKYLIDEHNAVRNMNEHWMPMYELCQPCHIKYDFVGSFEALDLDTSALLATIHASKTVTFPKRQATYGIPLADKDVVSFYTNITADDYLAIHRRYLNDFKCFSYRLSNRFRNVQS